MGTKHNHELIFMEPVLQKRIWGGSRLKNEWGYDSEQDKELGECWAVSCNEQTDSRVTEGEYRGKHLSQLWREEPELFGREADGTEFPLLIKIIDAKENLSVQVHPDDTYAEEHEHSKGKRECWYILDCPLNAELIVGTHAKDRDELKRMIEEKKWDDLLNRIPVKKGDFIQIDPGTIHAITAGVELLEVQQNSDVTYRIYDYDRLQNGTPRQLHLQQGMDVINVSDEISEESVIHPKSKDNILQRLISTCDYLVWTIRVNGVASVGRIANSFLIGSVLEGSGKCNGQLLSKGMHFIVPHDYSLDRIEGNLRINFAAPVYS